MILKELCSELTGEELLELEAAENRPIVYDEDCPEKTEEMLSQVAAYTDIWLIEIITVGNRSTRCIFLSFV